MEGTAGWRRQDPGKKRGLRMAGEKLNRLWPVLVDPERIEGRYYRGRIVRFNPRTGYGFVATPSGSHLFFYLDQVRLEGENASKREVQAGRLVGFDVGWTSRGLRISKLKLID